MKRVLPWLCMLWLAAEASWGQMPVQSAVNFVTKADRSRGALQVSSLDMGSYGNGAFAQTTVTITSKPATPADRRLTVVFYKKAWGSSGDHVAYRYPVTLAEGTSQVVVNIPHVGYDGQYAWDVEVWEDGRNIEDRRGNQGNWQADYQWTYRDNSSIDVMNFLYSGSESPSDLYDTAVEVIEVGERIAAAQQMLAIDQASRDWRIYLPYQRWIVSADTLLALHEQNPEGAEGLSNYVAAGGTVIVHSANSANLRSKVTEILPGYMDSAEKDKSFRDVRHMFGRFGVTSASLGDIPPAIFNIGRPLNSMVNPTTLYIQSSDDGDWFWRNMILAVGKPPVWAFCVIVTLFGGLLGPGLLYYTGRLRRRSLMIFLVPCLSLLATLSIVLYGVLYEGFETHTRTTSVQFVDSDGRGFAWSRQNYFSGLPPRDGLSFPHDAYVRSVKEPSTRSYYGSPDPRRATQAILLEGDQQRWLKWLQARQQQQLLVGRTLEKVTLPVTLQRIEEGKLQVTNLSDSFLPVVVARGAKDDYYATPVEAGTSVIVEAVDRVQAGAAAARLVADYRPEVPPDLLGSSNTLQLGWRTNSGIVGNRATDVIVRTFNAYLTDQVELLPGGVAVVSLSSDAVQPPINGKANNDVHLIVGSQPW